jgi:antitoxin component YwqK of YwqJK toxin-antitoxin module
LEFFETGKIRLKGQYKENRRDGEWLIFNDAGEIVLKEHYQ